MSALSKAFRSVYDATSDSSSTFGKYFGRWHPALAGPYLVRDAWRKYGKKLMPANSASSVVSSSDVYGPTGSVVGRY